MYLLMNKIATYTYYFWDYFKNGDVHSILTSIKYVINKTSHHSDRIITTSIGTFHCRKNTNDFQFANFYYEWGVKKYILQNKKEYNVFIDGGACIGDYDVMLAKHNLRCIAIEPDQRNFDAMQKNLELNHLETAIKTFCCGLGAKNQQAKILFDPINTGASRVIKEGELDGTMVQIRTFDSLLPEMNLSNEDHILFKLDVEGMEVEAIIGATEFIRLYPNITFVIEDKHTGVDPIKETLSQIASFEFGKVDAFNIYAKKIG